MLSFAIDDAQIKKTVPELRQLTLQRSFDHRQSAYYVLAGPSLQLTGVTYSPAGEPSQLTPKLAADSIDVRLQWRDIFDRKLHFILDTEAAQFVFVQTTDLSSSAAPVTSPLNCTGDSSKRRNSCTSGDSKFRSHSKQGCGFTLMV